MDSTGKSAAKWLARWSLVATMVGVGALHFIAEPYFTQIVPPFLPAPKVLVWISGVFEIGLGLALLPVVTRRLASYGLVALYLAVFPANIYMALYNVQLQGLPEGLHPSPLALWLRLPFQFVFIAWAIWVGRPVVAAQPTRTATRA